MLASWRVGVHEDGLPEWRANDWQWEHFGEMVPVKNRDLWQRVDRALGYHELKCRTWLRYSGSQNVSVPQVGSARKRGKAMPQKLRRCRML